MVNLFPQKRYRQSIWKTIPGILWCLGAMILLTVVSGIWMYRSSIRILEENNEQVNRKALESAADLLDVQVGAVQQQLYTIAHGTAVRNISTIRTPELTANDYYHLYELLNLLTNQVEGSPLYQSVYVYFGYDDSVISASGKLSAQEYYRQNVTSTGISYEQWHNGMQANLYSRFYYLTTEDSDGTVKLHMMMLPLSQAASEYYPIAVCAIIDSEYLQEALASMMGANGCGYEVLDPHNTVLSQLRTETENKPRNFQNELKLQHWTFRVTYDNQAQRCLMFGQMTGVIVLIVAQLLVTVLITMIVAREITRKMQNLLRLIASGDQSAAALPVDENGAKQVREEIRKADTATQAGLIAQILYGIHPVGVDSPRIWQEYGITFPNPGFQCLVLRVLPGEMPDGEESDSYLRGLILTVQRTMTELLAEDFTVYSTQLAYEDASGGTIGFILNPAQEDTSNRIRSAYLSLRSDINEQFDCDVHLGVGSYQNGRENISLSLTEAERVLEYSRFNPKEGIWFARTVEENSEVRSRMLYDARPMLSNVQLLVEQGEAGKAGQVIRQICAEIENYSREDTMSLQFAYTTGQMIQMLDSIRAKYPMLETTEDFRHKIAEAYSLQEMQDCMLAAAERISNQLAKGREDPGLSVVKQVNALIEANLGNSALSLTMIAQKMNFNPSYLSALYKRNARGNISETIAACRMKEAKKLLEKTDLTVNAIAAQVGFENYATFIRTYKKFYLVTPGKYREVIRQQTANLNQNSEEENKHETP